MGQITIWLFLFALTTACETFHFRKNPYENASPEQRDNFLKVQLPFPPQTSFKISQGAFGDQSHNEKGNEYSWDFDVPYGTPVTAVEEGIVIEVWSPNRGGDCNREFANLAHNLKIRHRDGTVAQYVHIESHLKVGDFVQRRQQIAVTAKNGWICQAQLHFAIYKSDQNLYSSPERQTVPVFFLGIPDGLARQGLEY